MKKQMKKISFAVLTVFSVGVGPLILDAWALPSNEVETVFYSGPDYQQEVGGQTLTCQGRTFRWGVRTRFYLKNSTPCHER